MFDNIEINLVNEETILREMFKKEYWERFPATLIVKKVKDWTFAVSSNWININTYVNSKWEVILNVIWVWKHYYFKKASILAWYWEQKNEKTGEYEMFKIKSIDEKTNKMIPEKKVDKLSEEYFQAWMDIAFYSLLLSKEVLLIEATDWWYNQIRRKWLEVDTQHKVLRIIDLVSYYKNWQITQELYKEFLPKVKQQLKDQIQDERLWRVWRQVTQEELDWYLKDNFINTDEYKILIESLEEFKKTWEDKNSEINSSINNTKEELDNLKNQ